MTTAQHNEHRAMARPQRDRLNARLAKVLAIHFDPNLGTPYWLDRQHQLGIDARKDIRSIDTLSLLGEMSQRDLAGQDLRAFIPRRFHDQMHRFIIGQTGGTTGDGVWTAYLDHEFVQAFITPFVIAAKHLKFPTRAQWLFVGPSGPHIIGKVIGALANAMESADPFTIDLDPLWVRRLEPGSFARQRYLTHIIDQTMRVINAQSIGVLFSTPPVIEALALEMSQAQRHGIGAIHFGGMQLTSQQLAKIACDFPHALLLAGYGNTLMGCCLELDAPSNRSHLDYYPFGDRLILEIVDQDGHPVPDGDEGRVRFTRLDDGFLIVSMRERDLARRVALIKNPPSGYASHGIRDPHPPKTKDTRLVGGLY